MMRKCLTAFPIINLFFRKCYNCNKHFIKGFKIIQYSKSLKCNFTGYSCNKCNKSEEEIINKLERD